MIVSLVVLPLRSVSLSTSASVPIFVNPLCRPSPILATMAWMCGWLGDGRCKFCLAWGSLSRILVRMPSSVDMLRFFLACPVYSISVSSSRFTFGRIQRQNCRVLVAQTWYPYFVERKPIMLKKGTQIATRVIANGQYGAGSAGMLVIPKMLVTNVRGCIAVSLKIYGGG